jgi:hypothetical protein
MAGRHVAAGRPSITAAPRTSETGRRAATPQTRTFAGTPLNVDGVTRDALAASSLVGSSIPKGPLAFTLAASHGVASYDLADSGSSAQQNIGSAVAGVDVISKSRSLRAVARNAEGVAPTADPLSVQSARLLASGRGPLVSVMGLTPGDLARAVAEFDRYGYTVNRAMIPPRLDAMTKRTYWQTAETTVVGSLPQADRQTIASAFERGVTVWSSVAEIGTHPANAPQSGVTY